jgi:hypothetical protein
LVVVGGGQSLCANHYCSKATIAAEQKAILSAAAEQKAKSNMQY